MRRSRFILICAALVVASAASAAPNDAVSEDLAPGDRVVFLGQEITATSNLSGLGMKFYDVAKLRQPAIVTGVAPKNRMVRVRSGTLEFWTWRVSVRREGAAEPPRYNRPTKVCPPSGASGSRHAC